MFLEAVERPRPELIEIPAGPGDTNDWHIQVSTLHHALQRMEHLFVGKIARRSKEDQRVRMQIAHKYLPSAYDLSAAFSRCPPN